ncbi:hypothetical protein QJQ45_028363, partial [Haematococcus lacustris]
AWVSGHCQPPRHACCFLPGEEQARAELAEVESRQLRSKVQELTQALAAEQDKAASALADCASAQRKAETAISRVNDLDLQLGAARRECRMADQQRADLASEREKLRAELAAGTGASTTSAGVACDDALLLQARHVPLQHLPSKECCSATSAERQAHSTAETLRLQKVVETLQAKLSTAQDRTSELERSNRQALSACEASTRSAQELEERLGESEDRCRAVAQAGAEARRVAEASTRELQLEQGRVRELEARAARAEMQVAQLLRDSERSKQSLEAERALLQEQVHQVGLLQSGLASEAAAVRALGHLAASPPSPVPPPPPPPPPLHPPLQPLRCALKSTLSPAPRGRPPP